MTREKALGRTKSHFAIDHPPTTPQLARALLAAHIEELRARRQAADGTGAKNRRELMEIRRKKEEARKERKKHQRVEAKTAEDPRV